VPKEEGVKGLPKSKRIRSKRKHDQEILRHIRMGDIDKALKTISKDPEDNLIKFAERKVFPMLKRASKR
jgi:hypothetical protein